MILVISPAKALDYETPPHVTTHTQPLFVKDSTELIEVLRDKTPLQISELMDLSDALSGLNVARYQAWRPKFTAKNAKQAVLAFDGDVYDGLAAKTTGGRAGKRLMEACYIADLLLGWQDEGRARPAWTYRLFARMFGEQAKK